MKFTVTSVTVLVFTFIDGIQQQLIFFKSLKDTGTLWQTAVTKVMADLAGCKQFSVASMTCCCFQILFGAIGVNDLVSLVPTVGL